MKYLIPVSLFFLLVVGIFAHINWVKEPQTFGAIERDNCITDDCWKEAIKKEQLNIRLRGELDAMLVSHQNKLERMQSDTKIVDCPECVRYEIEQDLISSYRIEGRELSDEVEKQYQEILGRRILEIEKLQQSIERIEKAIELQ